MGPEGDRTSLGSDHVVYYRHWCGLPRFPQLQVIQYRLQRPAFVLSQTSIFCKGFDGFCLNQVQYKFMYNKFSQ